MTAPPIPALVAVVFDRYPAAVRARLMEIREAIFAVAAETPGVGALVETLKWGEPAYLTQESRSGSSIRLGVSRQAADCGAVFFNCQTTLVPTFRMQFEGVFGFEGNRAILIPAGEPLPRAPLAFCLHAALTYHRRKSGA
ncbi:DUF1801 domain-containing protein [Shinella sp. 838]|jgi:hypothetical protein|uniref:DUF1801 domain-containing protein n=1 Tax=unclassified Shinella TaxID=2643062 RepID=UPI0003C55254|nr:MULTISPECIES: DUF1801 domain-containing protein [unclassified Shinella]MCA0343584.1 DUF1801 domain-containing protein [Pseudomonadota bacterium]MDC7262441.1 DUF1801 domain-containing protein [Shinella sp. HY16]MDC7269336.1 DUF1801 domain-containing protein [Shinella sp. YZ44]EYR77793.1 hypothetical protein SHLA_34c000050 [Shinella sp. DD12]MDG4670644.1 DUF1801 domain-containing protein [Shinella sp. 838]